MIPESAIKYLYHEEPGITLLHGDCLEVLPHLDPESISSVLTDPPYGLSFMGKSWDHGVPGEPFWREINRVCRPGAMLMAFGGTRTHHRLTCAIEDAGWEIRDCLMWLYGSGFPKSLNISKAIDKVLGAERAKILASDKGGNIINGSGNDRPWHNSPDHKIDDDNPVSPEATDFDGWGTALKPAWEPIVLAMKALDGTFAQNALTHGIAGLNINDSRIGTEERINISAGSNEIYGQFKGSEKEGRKISGRYPANIILDEESASVLDAQTGELTSGKMASGTLRASQDKSGSVCYGKYGGNVSSKDIAGDSGGPSRFFYVAKANNTDRGNTQDVHMPLFGEVIEGVKNMHSTVKPLDLMNKLIDLEKYLLTLMSTPSGGVILDPFGGSCTTAVSAKQLGRECIVITEDIEDLKIGVQRLEQEITVNA